MKKLVIALLFLSTSLNAQESSFYELVRNLQKTPCQNLEQLNRFIQGVGWEVPRENSNYRFGYVNFKLPGYEYRKTRLMVKLKNDTIQMISFKLNNLTMPERIDLHKEFVSYNISVKQIFRESDSAIYHHEEWLIKGKHPLTVVYEWSCGAREGTVKYSIKLKPVLNE